MEQQDPPLSPSVLFAESSDPWLPSESDSNRSHKLSIPSLTHAHYNTVLDVHATCSASQTELIFSSNGNWELALERLFHEKYFVENPSVRGSYLYTTSPPISTAQMKSGLVKVGNVMWTGARPHVAAGPRKAIRKLEDANYTIGEPVPIIRTMGCVIIKRSGDRHIESFWDLRDLKPGRFATSDPVEGGSYNNYRTTLRNIARKNPRMLSTESVTDEEAAERREAEALALETYLFDETSGGGIAPRVGHIMHRSIPHAIATGRADAALCFYHLAVSILRQNPGVFEAVYLAKDRMGSTGDPDVLAEGQEPLEGTLIGEFYAVKTSAEVNSAQERARENFIECLQSDEFTVILEECGLRRPRVERYVTLGDD